MNRLHPAPAARSSTPADFQSLLSCLRTLLYGILAFLYQRESRMWEGSLWGKQKWRTSFVVFWEHQVCLVWQRLGSAQHFHASCRCPFTSLKSNINLWNHVGISLWEAVWESVCMDLDSADKISFSFLSKDVFWCLRWCWEMCWFITSL